MTRNLKEFVNQNADVRSAFDVYGNRHVAILLAHYNGGAWLEEQLQSLSAQTHRDWSLILSDDGSSDNWLETTAEFAKAEPDRRVWLINGPQSGFAQNFLSLVAIAGPSVPYAAFCDQDDVWCSKKLETALKALNAIPPAEPAIYCGRTTLVDQTLQPLGLSPLFQRKPEFRNALVQSIGGGNTMVLNRAALDLLQDSLHHAKGVVSHDWWAYQIVTGAGGRVIYDAEPQVLYRQHSQNLIGSNAGWAARLRRARSAWCGTFRNWNAANTAALARASHWLAPEAREMLHFFEMARNGNLKTRLLAMRKSGVYRQSRGGQIALWLAVLFKRL